MNQRQKLVQKQFLNNEEAVIKKLKTVYSQALRDIEKKALELQSQINSLDLALEEVEDEKEKTRLKSMKQSKVYQKQYQDALKKQVSSILDNMQVEEFKTVSEYLQKCYEDGFIGTLYDMQGQGIPLCFPMDQEAVVRAVQLDSKISNGLYSRLGEDVTTLKKKITAQVSRGISTGMSFAQVAKQLSSETRIGFNNAVRIARTEGHRIQVQSTMDACYKAKDRGAEVAKQWDATLDGKTRPSHQKVDGEVKELDEKFSNGLMFPGDPSGGAAEVVNCRCALLQRGRWALEGGLTKRDNFTGELRSFETPEDYAEFKKWYFSKENTQYMNYVDTLEKKYQTKDFGKVLSSMTDQEYKHYKKLLDATPMYKSDIEKSGKSGTIKASSSSTIAMAKKLPDAKERSRVINEAINTKEPIYANDLRIAYKNVKPKEGCKDIVLHGAPFYTEYEHKYILDTETLSYIISGRKDWQGQNIRLLSCSTGKADKYGNCVAQELANLLGVNVYAPIKDLNIHKDGTLSVGKTKIPESEGFKWYYPKKKGGRE